MFKVENRGARAEAEGPQGRGVMVTQNGVVAVKPRACDTVLAMGFESLLKRLHNFLIN